MFQNYLNGDVLSANVADCGASNIYCDINWDGIINWWPQWTDLYYVQFISYWNSVDVAWDGIDNDGNGLIDDQFSNLLPLAPEWSCTNNIDDDKDGQIDCKDSDCDTHASCDTAW